MTAAMHPHVSSPCASLLRKHDHERGQGRILMDSTARHVMTERERVAEQSRHSRVS